MNGSYEAQNSFCADVPAGAEPMRILWVGEPTLAMRFMSRRAPQVHIAACDAGGVHEQFAAHAVSDSPLLDLIVVDATHPGVDALQIAALAESHSIDLPVILLTTVGQESLALRMGQRVVCDCIVKTQDFIHQLLPTIVQVRARHDLQAALEVSRQREERVRTILEMQPAVACIVEPGGRLMAVNHTGQMLFGGPAEQLIGRNIADFVPSDDWDSVLSMFNGEALEARAVRTHAVTRLDGTARRVQTQSVPLARLEGMVSLVTMDDRTELSAGAQPDYAAAGLGAEIAALREENGRLAAAHAADLSAWEQKIHDSDARQATLCTDLDAAQSALRAVDVERARLAQSMVEHDQFHAGVRSQLEAECERLTLALRDLEIQHRALVERLQWEASIPSSPQWEPAAAPPQQHDETIQTLEAERARQEAAIAQLEAERNRFLAAVESLQAQCDALSADRARFDVAASEPDAVLREAEARQHVLAAERQQLELELAREREQQALHVQALAQLTAERDQLLVKAEEAEGQRTAAGMRHDQPQIAAAFQELQRRYDSFEVERTAERAQWALTASRASDDQRSALRTVEAECERLTDALCQAEARLSERQIADAAQRHAERAGNQSIALELRASQDRIQQLLQDVTELQAALSQSDARVRTLRRSVATAETKAAEISQRFDRLMEADRSDLLQLRRDLFRFLGDAERQCKALTERRTTDRAGWDSWPVDGDNTQGVGDVRSSEPASGTTADSETI